MRVDVVTEAAFLARIAQWVEERRPRQVVTINPEFVMRAHGDARLTRRTCAGEAGLLHLSTSLRSAAVRCWLSKAAFVAG